ncbi:MAG: fatty acid desaturase [Candidatus Neptunochlamydia sp.]|nr:fatty acid desaturase [Candidatus Neptunochlamydia sp.]
MKKNKIEWTVSIYIIGYHLALLIGLPFYFYHFSPKGSLFIAAAIILYISGLAITVGYHRLYSHSTFKTNKYVEAVILFFGSMATQGSALEWSCDHRRHHAFVDTDRDPYSIKKGFMHAHMFWLFRKTEPLDQKVVADLYRNKFLRFQHKYYAFLMVLTNVMVTLFVGYILDDYLGALVITWGIRLFFLHHFSWFINSIAHTWGSQSFSQEHTAVDNYLISLVTFGEGYHNYHHTFANDYRNGIKWYHFDPSKWVIWTLNKLHLATGLRRISSYRIKERMVIETKEELIAKLKTLWFDNKKSLEQRVENLTDDLLSKLSEMKALAMEYNTSKKEGLCKSQLKSLKNKLKVLEKNLHAEWESWQKFAKAVIRHEAA